MSWYDEQAEWLTELVASLANAGIDTLVALDGAYQLYPNGHGRSPQDQTLAIQDTAATHGIVCTIHTPVQPWPGNETQKRTVLFALGHAHATPHEDWLLVADGDEIWTDTTGLRDNLEQTVFDTAEVMLYEGQPPATHNFNPIRKLFRADPSGIQVIGAHYIYRTGDERYLWAPSRPTEQVDADRFPNIRVRHRPSERTQQRNQGRNGYYEMRVQTHIEDYPYAKIERPA